MERQCGIYLDGESEQAAALSDLTRHDLRRDRPRYDLAHAGQLVIRIAPRLRELTVELQVRVRARFDVALPEITAKAEPPRELDRLDRERGRRRRDLPKGDLPPELALKVTAALRRLLGMKAIDDEWLVERVRLGVLEDPRPELVVLALPERLVVTQPVLLEELAVEGDRVVEERRRAEERVPARHCGARLRKMHGTDPAARLELDDARADERDPRLGLDSREHALEPVGERDVVRIHARDVATPQPRRGRG